ncbi:hypothetical protein ACTQ5K_02860 [Niallia sp. Sow4_A1]|uniref:hypothetical protein n=1 Tax=Niallia sp. Sow4_A1 TaxID=3438793 RepID=UPI003F9CE42A
MLTSIFNGFSLEEVMILERDLELVLIDAASDLGEVEMSETATEEAYQNVLTIYNKVVEMVDYLNKEIQKFYELDDLDQQNTNILH